MTAMEGMAEAPSAPRSAEVLITMATRHKNPHVREWAARMRRFYDQGVNEGLDGDAALAFARKQESAYHGLDRLDPIRERGAQLEQR